MRLSIQGRLTLWYTAALLAALTACGVAVYAAVLNREMGSVDDDLRRTASTTAFSMRAEATEGLDLRAAATDTQGELSISGTAVALFDGQAHLLAARWEGLEPIQPSPTDGLDAPRTIRIRNAEWRTLLTRHAHQGADYLILSAMPLDPVRRHTERIRLILLAIIPVAVALAALGGWMSARSTLRPISRLAAEANQVAHDQPDVRLSVPGGEDELALLATAFNALLQRLQTANQAQRQFMADASHELRTPVSVIRSAADVTLSRPHRTSEEYEDSIGVIAEQAERLTRLVEDLFLLSRADVKARPLATSRFYLDDVLAECVRAAEVLGAPKHMNITMTAEKDVEIEADEDLIRRMLLNLLENAVRYNPPMTRVDVQLKHSVERTEISIADDGRGIEPKDRARIFERFVRLDHKASTGAGLGLPIARWIAEAHGGSLVLDDSKPGTTFVVRLPL
jgi:heavy metal sensor kinase